MADLVSRSDVDIARMIADTIAHPTSHSMKHMGEFNDPRFGTPLDIATPKALQDHAFNVLTSPETRVFHTRGTVTYMMHEPTQTCINLCVHGRFERDGGTIYKFDPQRYTSKSDWITKAVAKEAERMGVESFPEQKGFLSLLQENPEARQLFEERYAERLAAKQPTAQNAGAEMQRIPVNNGSAPITASAGPGMEPSEAQLVEVSTASSAASRFVPALPERNAVSDTGPATHLRELADCEAVRSDDPPKQKAKAPFPS